MLTVKLIYSADREGSASSAPGSSSLLDEIVRDGARAMLAAALQAEVAAYIDARRRASVDENGYRLVVRNGYHGTRGGDRRGCGAGAGAAGQRQAHR